MKFFTGLPTARHFEYIYLVTTNKGNETIKLKS